MSTVKKESAETPAQVMKGNYKILKDFLKRDLKFDKAPSELTDEEIADIMNYLRDLKSVCEAREKLLGQTIQSRHQEDLQQLVDVYKKEGRKEYFVIPGGATPGLQYEYVVQNRLDAKAIEEEMGAGWIEEHKKETTFYQARVVKEV